jgi:hypothetical protein
MAEGILQRLMTETWPAKLAKSALEALMLPGQVYQGQVSMTGPDGRTNPEAINKAADLAGLVTGGSYAAAPAMKNASGMGIKAYHGSPHDFDKFDLSKIGTGEGAQAYGHGLYFAENEGVAKAYREALSPKSEWKISPDKIADELSDFGFDPRALDMARNTLRELGGDGFQAVGALDGLAGNTGNKVAKEAASVIRSFHRNVKPGGKMYEVNINAHPDQFLDWDKPLSGQSGQVRQSIPEIVAMDEAYRKRFPHSPMADPFGSNIYSQMQATGGLRIPDAKAQAAEVLRERGIPGIKYLDQGSRNAGGWHITPSNQTTSGKWMVKSSDYNSKGMHFDTEAAAQAALAEKVSGQTSNYVVFDDKLIDILRKYGIAGAGPLAALMAQGEEAGVQ